MINLSSDCSSQYSVERSVYTVNENPKSLITRIIINAPFNTVLMFKIFLFQNKIQEMISELE